MIGATFDGHLIAADSYNCRHDADLGISFCQYKPLFNMQLDVRGDRILEPNRAA